MVSRSPSEFVKAMYAIGQHKDCGHWIVKIVSVFTDTTQDEVICPQHFENKEEAVEFAIETCRGLTAQIEHLKFIEKAIQSGKFISETRGVH